VRFLADESCDFAVVRSLRNAGFDVVAVAEVAPRALDEAVIELAVREDRIVLTEDKDFGQLVYGSGRPSSGVILLDSLAVREAASQKPFCVWSTNKGPDWRAHSQSSSLGA